MLILDSSNFNFLRRKEMYASNEYLKSFRYNDGSNNYLGDILTNLDYLTKAYTTPTKSEIGL